MGLEVGKVHDGGGNDTLKVGTRKKGETRTGYKASHHRDLKSRPLDHCGTVSYASSAPRPLDVPVILVKRSTNLALLLLTCCHTHDYYQIVRSVLSEL